MKHGKWCAKLSTPQSKKGMGHRMDGVHFHFCPEASCGRIWSHDAKDIPPDGHRAAHTCPACQKGVNFWGAKTMREAIEDRAAALGASRMQETETKPAPVAGFFIGTLSGFLISILFGILGMIFFPFWLPAVLAMVIMPFAGMTPRKGECPHCRKENILLPGKAAKCSSCRHRLEIRGHKLVDLT